MSDTRVHPRGGRLQMPRSRGAMSGFLLILLGLWGALIPFVGPYFNFAFTPDEAWAWTSGRGWLEVLPGLVTVVGGLLLLTSRNRATAMLGGWLAVAGGAWFVIGRAMAGPLGIGDAGTPVAATETKQVWLELTYFYGLGALIVFFGAAALGRLSIRSVRDIHWAEQSAAAPAAADAPAGAAPAATTESETDSTTGSSTTGPNHTASGTGDQRTDVIGPTAEAQGRKKSWKDIFRSRGDRHNKFAHR
ncbi:hypothetical protein [Mycobacterium sp. IDR2000157661]|uniref:hypothetical protein n=1 Tax=Mycobacterium sp. IDR2000157661 TaxID=2867005 RepID=UPI001EEBE510|nr:hypothetical protein [Mycobacterium sp. IDR2000157661]ULE32836.1 hypothetical protein K3G64_22625 [Mycobacterium sp. IDR2000157661]